MPIEEEFNEWKLHPVTQTILKLLQAKREELRQQWEGGSFTDYTQEGTVLINVGNLGTCKGYAFVTDLTYEQLTTELSDGE
jgi:hypothetical protein